MQKRSLFTLIIFIVSFSLMACQLAEKPNLPDNNNTNDIGRYNNNNNNMNNDMNMDNNMSARAENIADSVVDIAGVDDATVVITGDTALVGVDIAGKDNGEVTDNLKRSIINVVKKVDNRIDNVVVTASPDFFDRIDNIARDINRGKPLSGFVDEVNEIIRRVAPTAD